MKKDYIKVVVRDTPGVVDIIKKTLFVDFIKGMSLTLRYSLTRTIALRYPDKEKWVPYQRFRGEHTLNRDEQGRELCVACELCAKVCPTDCITVVPMEDDTGRGIADRVAKVWSVDLARCLFCGYCQDACPTTAVRLGRNYELACLKLEDAVKNIDGLLKPQQVPENFKGGMVVKARYERNKSGPKVRGNLFEKSDSFWWPMPDKCDDKCGDKGDGNPDKDK